MTYSFDTNKSARSSIALETTQRESAPVETQYPAEGQTSGVDTQADEAPVEPIRIEAQQSPIARLFPLWGLTEAPDELECDGT